MALRLKEAEGRMAQFCKDLDELVGRRKRDLDAPEFDVLTTRIYTAAIEAGVSLETDTAWLAAAKPALALMHRDIRIQHRIDHSPQPRARVWAIKSEVDEEQLAWGHPSLNPSSPGPNATYQGQPAEPAVTFQPNPRARLRARLKDVEAGLALECAELYFKETEPDPDMVLDLAACLLDYGFGAPEKQARGLVVPQTATACPPALLDTTQDRFGHTLAWALSVDEYPDLPSSVVRRENRIELMSWLKRWLEVLTAALGVAFLITGHPIFGGLAVAFWLSGYFGRLTGAFWLVIRDRASVRRRLRRGRD
jgi:hypothetical protein